MFLLLLMERCRRARVVLQLALLCSISLFAFDGDYYLRTLTAKSHLRPAISHETIYAINVGRDDHNEVWFGFEPQKNTLLLELRVPPSLQALCNKICLYRYYVHGGSNETALNSFAGYLEPGEGLLRKGHASPTRNSVVLSAAITVHERGNYTALIYLESLGEEAVDRLPMSLLSIPGGMASVADNSSDHDARFVAIVVSDPRAQLYANVSHPGSQKSPQLPPCRYEAHVGPESIFWVGVGEEAYARDEKCNMLTPSRDQFLRAANAVKGGVRVIHVGTSRLDHLLHQASQWLDPESPRPGKNNYWSVTNSSLTLQMAFTRPPAPETLAKYLKDANLTCSDTSGTDEAGLIVLVISYGIWEVRVGWHDTTNLTTKEFAESMRPNVEATLREIERVCADYRIVWAAQPGTTQFYKDPMCSMNAPGRDQYADVVSQNYFGGLSPASPHLRRLNKDVFEEMAARRGELYVPLDELYMAQCYISDHIHMWDPNMRQQGVNMLYTAILTEIERYLAKEKTVL